MTLPEARAAAISAHQAGDLAQARDLYRQYLARAPRDAAIWSNLGALFRTQKAYDMAAACQRRALEIDPDATFIQNNAANAFFDAGAVEEALALRFQTLKSDPDKAEHWSSLGKYLRALGRYEEAVETLQTGASRHPDDVEIRIQLAFAELSLGDYAKGFETFDYRWRGDELSLPEMGIPRWEGEDLAGRSILVIPEQGFGDTVLMARFLPLLASRGCRVRLVCKPPLRRLLSGIDGVELADGQDDFTGDDVWTPMMDLPRYLGVTVDDVPPPVPLHVPVDAVSRARAITAPFGERLKVGVLWSGSVTYRANHKRSFDHRRFLPMSTLPGVQLFSLYKGPLVEDYHRDGTSCLIVDAASSDRDFADSAALVCELDLVITMDSAIAHVAGSLGAKVWNLLHSEAYWLYEPFRDHSPWYPSMRLIRQEKPGDWDGVFATLEAEVERLAREKTA